MDLTRVVCTKDNDVNNVRFRKMSGLYDSHEGACPELGVPTRAAPDPRTTGPLLSALVSTAPPPAARPYASRRAPAVWLQQDLRAGDWARAVTRRPPPT